jgi:lipid A 3-O-deacylase
MSGRSSMLGVFCLARLLLNCTHLSALEAESAQPASWTLYIENDSFLNTDRYYTNGIRLTRSYSRDGLPRWAHRTRWMERIVDGLHRCSPGGNDGSCFDFEAAWTFGQNLYTPEDLRTSRLIPDQRPYGAWLYYGNVLTLSKPDLQHSLEIDVGAVGGSLALGEPVQRGWHSLLRWLEHSDTPRDPKGWRNQIKNQPGLNLVYQLRRRLIEGKTSELRYFDLVPQVSAALGTVNVQASVGATARFGYNLPNEFPDLVIPFAPPPPPQPPPPPVASPSFALASYRQPPAEPRARSLSARRWEAYLFARADRRYVAYSAFLDGNLSIFGRSHSVPRVPLVTDLQAGAVLGGRHWRLSVTLVDRSREFRAQRDHQRFASITVLRAVR